MFKMTPNVLRNLFFPKATRRYPREVRPQFKKVRGMLLNDIEKCTFCSACALKCPSQCIAVDKKAATWEYDPFACVFCGVCVEICPAESLYQKSEYWLPVVERESILLKGEPRKKIEKSS